MAEMEAIGSSSSADASRMPRYPAQREADVVLHDGATVHVRPVRASDEPGVLRFLQGLSDRSRALRFFGGAVNIASLAKLAVDVDYRDSYALVATTGAEGRVVGHAMYARETPESVEVAFAIADELQGRGLGTVLIAHLAEAAEAAGYEFMEAEVLPENHQMLEVFRESGYPFEVRSMAGAVAVRSPVSLSPQAVDRFEARDHEAAVAAVTRVLRPRSVAVVGASRDRARVGGAIFHNLVEAGFRGTAFPVNAGAASVQGVKAYPSVRDVPDELDLVVIAVSADDVVDVARACGRRGVPALVVVSAGFSEAGEDGKRRQEELLHVCRENGMRLVGPNCLGVLSTAPDVALNATFARRQPPRGPLALMSQSGALGLAVIDQAAERGLGMASFVSAGNKADVSGNDLLEFWLDDPDTRVIALYLESFGNPRKFARVAPRVSREKPIVAVKSGRSAAGARAAASHTGAALAASELTVDALFRQAGVIRASTLAELLDVSALLGTQPLPASGRVAIITNSGGPGILCADALESEGLAIASLSPSTRRELEALLPAAAAVGNPVDMLATAGSEQYCAALELLGRDSGVDAVIAIYTPTGLDRPEDVLPGIAAGADAVAGRMPVLGVALTPDRGGSLLPGERSSTPLYALPEDAARALAHACRHAQWRARPDGRPVTFGDTRPEEAAAVIAEALADGGGWLSPDRVQRLLGCYGIPLVETRSVASAAEAGRAAADIGAPVALKAVAPGLVHKTELGAVRLGLSGRAAVARNAADLRRELGAAGHDVEGFVVQPMAGAGVEMLVGVVHDPVFGPVVVCGAGGTAAELLNDVAARITPLTDADARELVRSLRTYPLLEGWRGAPAADTAGLEEVILRVAALVETHAEIAELDLNPVLVAPGRPCVVDARVSVRAAPPPQPWPALGATPPTVKSRDGAGSERS
jgi:acetyl coenzyme A synthetase (ADP forming)-like protein